MKKGDKFRIDYQWWDKERPELLPSTGLGAAFKAYETAKRGFQSALTIEAHREAVAALDDVESARVKAVRLCGPAFKVEKAIFTAGGKVVADERDKLDELGRARAKVHAQEIAKDVDGFVKSMRKMDDVCSQAEDFLIQASEKSNLTEKEKNKLAEALKSLADTIYNIEDVRSRIANIDKRRPYMSAVYFKADPDVSRIRRSGIEESTNRQRTDDLKNLATAVGAQYELSVTFKSHV